MSEKRIYVAVAETVQPARGSVVQPPGRQIAQACHAVSKLRWLQAMDTPIREAFSPITTIILQARDCKELVHVSDLLRKKKLEPVWFYDNNLEAYGPGEVVTAVAVLATKYQVTGVLDYLPSWGKS